MKRSSSFRLLVVLSSFGLLGCGTDTGAPPARPRTLRALDPPAAPGALAFRLSGGPAGVFATWLEPGDPGHRLLVSKLEGDVWATPAVVAAGDGFFANWADTPGLLQAEDGSLTAHWLAKIGEGTYAYGVHLAHSSDGGATWSPGALLHDDVSPTEHGFVSGRPWGGGALAAWLDGRGTADGQPMQLRATRVGTQGPEPSELLAASVCDCCPTAMAIADGGPVVAFRGRTAEEIRDIGVIRHHGTGWSEPVMVHDDGWRIAGCPVNGPAIGAAGRRVAVAWFTGANGLAKVQVAFSEDGGASFGRPVLLDDADPIGRVGLAIDAGGAWVSWLAKRADGRGAVMLAHVTPAGLEAVRTPLAEVSTARSAGVPRLLRDGERLLVAWLDDADPASLHVTALDASAS